MTNGDALDTQAQSEAASSAQFEQEKLTVNFTIPPGKVYSYINAIVLMATDAETHIIEAEDTITRRSRLLTALNGHSIARESAQDALDRAVQERDHWQATYDAAQIMREGIRQALGTELHTLPLRAISRIEGVGR